MVSFDRHLERLMTLPDTKLKYTQVRFSHNEKERMKNARTLHTSTCGHTLRENCPPTSRYSSYRGQGVQRSK
jgi:hypothetical protein